jgi:membrane-associated phospholipid phosphatase
VVFVAWMAFAAVYLDHHWIIDVLLGFAYAVGAFALIRVIFARILAPDRDATSHADPIVGAGGL